MVWLRRWAGLSCCVRLDPRLARVWQGCPPVWPPFHVGRFGPDGWASARPRRWRSIPASLGSQNAFSQVIVVHASSLIAQPDRERRGRFDPTLADFT